MPFGWLTPSLAAAGVIAYAGRPRTRRARPKDVLVLKNAVVAAGITGFATMVAIGAAASAPTLAAARDIALAHALQIALACVHVAVRVFADAALCDLDDERSDRSHGTVTLPTQLGRTRAWNVAMALRIVAAIALVPIAALPLAPRLAWAVVTIITSLAMRLAAPGRVRDWVDARFFLEAAAITALLAIIPK
jgi:4-hydroxybenzoate polyprenyltransferase